MTISKMFFIAFSLSFLMISCSKDSDNDVQTYSIQGRWINASGVTYKVSGTTAVYDGDVTLNKYSQASIDQGFFSLNSPVIKDISSNGKNKWNAKTFRFTYEEDATGVTILDTAYVSIDITISDGGKILSGSGVNPDFFQYDANESFSINWTRNE